MYYPSPAPFPGHRDPKQQKVRLLPATSQSIQLEYGQPVMAFSDPQGAQPSVPVTGSGSPQLCWKGVGLLNEDLHPPSSVRVRRASLPLGWKPVLGADGICPNAGSSQEAPWTLSFCI